MNYVAWIFTKLVLSSRKVNEAGIWTSCALFWTLKKLCSLYGIVSQRRRNFHYNYYFPRPKHDGRTVVPYLIIIIIIIIIITIDFATEIQVSYTEYYIVR